MKHLFTILCAMLCCGAYPQANAMTSNSLKAAPAKVSCVDPQKVHIDSDDEEGRNVLFSCIFDKAECMDEWTVIDANNDYVSWMFTISPGGGDVDILYNGAMPNDDYLVTKQPINVPAGSTRVTVKYNARDFYTQKFELMYGKTDDVSQMTVLKEYEFTNEDGPYEDNVDFDAPEEGEYYFAIHDVSDADMLGIYIYKFEVSQAADGITGINTVKSAAKAPVVTYDATSKTIVARSQAGVKSLEVYSASGSKMGSKATSSSVCSYDASRLAPGVYVVKVNTVEGTTTSKVAIK